METVACNLCGCTEYRHYATIPDLLLERLDVTATLVQCTDCGLVYQNPRPTLSEMGQHYPSDYEPYADTSPTNTTTRMSGKNWLVQKAIAYGIHKRCRFVTRHKTGGSLLDVGCATGTFLLGMQQDPNWETVGVELSDEVAEFARTHNNLDVFTGTLEEANFPDEQFDAVTMWDVLEHLHDPEASMREIHRILKPDGIVVMRVPNLHSWDAVVFGNNWAGLDAPRHLYVFTPTTLNALLAKSGYEFISNSSAIGGYVTFALSVRFWLTARGASPKVKRTTRKILYNPIARLISVPVFYIPSVLRRGPMIVTTARKAR